MDFMWLRSGSHASWMSESGRRVNRLLAAAVGMALVWSCSGPTSQQAGEAVAFDSHLREGRALMGAGKLAQGLVELNRAKDAEPSRTEPYLLRSQILEGAGHYREALAEVTAAYKLSPDKANILMSMVQLGAGFVPPA